MKNILCLLVLWSLIGTSKGQAPASQKNAALQYYQAILSVPPEISLNPQERKAVEEWATTPLDSTTESLLAKFRRALACLGRGAACQNCEWGLTQALQEDGFEDSLPYLSQTGRSLARVALLKARWAFAHGGDAEGYEKILTVMVFARHIGSANVLLTKMLEFAMEENAIDLAAAHLISAKDPVLLKLLLDRIAKLPQSPRISEVIRTGEKAIFIGSIKKHGLSAVEVYLEDLHGADLKKKVLIRSHLGLNEENLPKLCVAIGKIFDEAADIATKPLDECSKAESRFKERLATEMDSARPLITNIFPRLILPAIQKHRNVEAKIEAKFALLHAAVGIVTNGVEKLSDFKDPFGNGEFEYRKNDNGFELRSKLASKNEPVRLIVGNQTKK